MGAHPDRHVAVITGASSGVGKAAAKLLAMRGWHVIAHGRDPARCALAEAELRAVASPDARIDMIRGDLALLADSARLADEICNLTSSLHALLNNAGGVRNSMTITAEGNEATFAGNHLGHFLLTKRLMPLLRETAATSAVGSVRVLSVSSEGHEYCAGLDWEDLQQTAAWISGKNYCLAKLCNILFTRELAKRADVDGIIAHAMHPGEVASNFASHAVAEMKAYMEQLDAPGPEAAAQTLVWLATDPDVGKSSGGYFHNLERVTPSAVALDDAMAARLWEESEQLLSKAGY